MNRTTYARASLEYDTEHETVLMEAITVAIFEASKVSDCNAIIVRTGEAANALMTVLAGILAMSPSVTRSPTAIRNTADEIGKRLRPKVTAAERNADVQDFVRRIVSRRRHRGDGMTQTKPAPTAAAAFFQHRRAEFEANAANRALSAMRRGAVLRLQYRDGRPSWLLDGKQISAQVAALTIASELVGSAGDALFDGMSQTWRYVS